MSMRALRLADVQRWMQGVIVHPAPMPAALRAPSVRAALSGRSVDDVILPSKALRPHERVAIYHGMYLLRMEEALETDYPGLRRLLGQDGFRDLVRRYVQRHPSRSYTLNRLGDHLPDFLARARVPHRPFARDLARLELAMTRVFDADETEALRPSDVAAMSPAAWETARLAPIAAFELLRLGHDVGAWLEASASGAPRPSALRRRVFVAVYRHDYGVYRMDLAAGAFALLTDLAGGRPLGPAIAAALSRRGAERPDEQMLFRWFREWVSRGLFRVHPRVRARSGPRRGGPGRTRTFD